MKRTHPFSSDDEFQAAVTQVYEDGWADYASRWETPHADHAEEWQRFMAAVKPGGSVLDVGCNAGTDAKRFVDQGYCGTGLDVSNNALRLCKQRCPQARTVQMNMLEMADLNERFDGVWMSYSLVHIPFARIHDALAAMESVLHPEGSLFMMMTVTDQPKEKLHNSNVMFEASGVPRKVPVAHWAPDPLVECFRSHFQICWQGRRPFVDGFSPFGLQVRSRRSTSLKAD